MLKIDIVATIDSKKKLIKTIFFFDNDSYLGESILWRDIWIIRTSYYRFCFGFYWYSPRKLGIQPEQKRLVSKTSQIKKAVHQMTRLIPVDIIVL